MLQRCCRILHVLPDLALGGGQQVVLRSIMYADRQRFDLHVCYLQPVRDMAPLFARQKVPLLFLPHTGWWRVERNLRQLVRYIRERRIDLIHVHGTPLDKFYGMAAAALCGLPAVRTLHGMHLPYQRPSLLRLLVRPSRIVRAAHHAIETMLDAILEPRTIRQVIAVSEPVRQSWAGYLKRRHIEPDRVMVIVSGVPLPGAGDCGKESLSDLRRQLGLADAWPIMISVGRITTAKGQDLLVSMMARLVRHWPQARLLLVGDGPLREPLQQEACRFGLERAVLFVGQRLDAFPLLALADALVFASHFEGLGLAVLEAMAVGKPVIAVQIPALQSFVQDGVSGRLVPRDADALADAVRDVLADPRQAVAMGRHGRQIVEQHYSMDRFIRTLEGVYLSVLRPPNPSEPRMRLPSACES